MPARRQRLSLVPLEDRWTPSVGDLDPTFGTGGKATYLLGNTAAVATSVSAVVVQPNGKAVLVGTAGEYDFTAVRLAADGTADPTFGQNGSAVVDIAGATDFANAAVVQPDGKIVLAGSAFNGSVLAAAVRLTADGQLDGSFAAAGKFTYAGTGRQDAFTAVAVQQDGKVVLAGTDSDPTSGVSRVLVVRLTAAGALDPTFGTGGVVQQAVGANSYSAGMVVLPDGRILVAGTTSDTPNGAGDAVLIELDATGQLDPSFPGKGSTTLDLGGADTVTGVALQPDGRAVVVGGTATGTTRAGVVARLQGDGTLDPTFGTGGRATVDLGGADQFNGVAVQPNGRLVLAVGLPGRLLATSQAPFAVARLNADGTPDTDFGPNGRRNVPFVTSAGASARAAAVLADGSLLVAGYSDTAFAAARFIGDNPPVTPGSLFVGGTADGTARVYAPTVGGFQANVPITVYPGFGGAVRTATADVNGDGVPDLITGPGGGPNVVVIDGKTAQKLADLNAFETSFTGGVYVAAADLNGDGKAEVVVTPDQGGGPLVVIYDGAKLAAGAGVGAQLTRFFGIEDPNFRGGARPALGDVNGDGTPDLVVAAGVGGGPRVALFDGGRVLAAPAAGQLPPKLTGDFFVFEPTLRNGVYVAAGDLTGDGAAEVVVGGGPGGGPRVFALDGKALAGGTQTPAVNLFAGDLNSRGGVRVAVRPDATGQPQLVTGSGAGEAAQVRVYKPATARAAGSPDQTLSPFNGVTLADGVSVG